MYRAFMILLCLPLPAWAASPEWYVFARDDGCVSLQVLARMNALPRAPTSPEDYAAMMRKAGHTVVLSVPPGLAAELEGQMIQVSIGQGRAPLFVRAALCQSADFSTRPN